MSEDKQQIPQPEAPEPKQESMARMIWNRLSLEAVGAVVYGGLDRRLELGDAVNTALKHPVPKYVNWTYCFGGITFFLFVVQAVSGILLTLYYQPSTADAYASVQYIMNDVRFGWLVRSIHRWAAELMVLMLMMHMLRVYFNGAYKHPRELNWLAGLGLFMLVMGFGFTGYLLPWDQKAYWGTTVGTKMPSEAPVIGAFIARFLKGGDEITDRDHKRWELDPASSDDWPHKE